MLKHYQSNNLTIHFSFIKVPCLREINHIIIIIIIASKYMAYLFRLFVTEDHGMA